MSQENVEIVRGVIEAADRRDAEAASARYDPEIEWNVSELGMGEASGLLGLDRVVHGHDELRAWLREWVSAWDFVEYEHEELIDAGDHVVHFLRSRVRGRGSGIELIADPYAQVWTLRDRKITRVKVFRDRDRALEAVGLDAGAETGEDHQRAD